MNINIMVGSGILIGPGIMAGVAGNASFLTWLVVALLFLPIVLCTVQLNRMNPGSGGFYTYAKSGLNSTAGYISGLLYMVGYTFSIAVEILALRKTLFVAMGHQWEWFTNNPLLFNGVVTLSIIGLNLLGLKLFSRIVNSLTIWKIVPIVTLILLLPFIISPTFTITASEVTLIPQAMPFAIFGFFGFEYACSISHLIENSERNAPLAILIGFFATALLYTLFNFGVLNLMGADQLSALGASSFAQFLTVPIPYFKSLMTFLIPTASAITLFAAGTGLLNANAVMMSSLAKDNIFRYSSIFAQETSWFRPWFAIILFGVLGFLIATYIPNIDVVGNISIAGVMMAFILPFIALINLQRRRGKAAQIPLTLAALAISGGLLIYILRQMGMHAGNFGLTTMIYRFLPFILLFVAGAALYRNPSTKETAR